jgi:2-oxoglutarate ferredoxin oxidoreductase subunit alpha
MTTFNWKIAGFAGEGIKIAGLIFSKTCFKHGFYVHGYTEYPSLIRGGHNTFQVLASSEQVLAPQTQLNLLVALNQNGLKKHQAELNKQSLILTDAQLNQAFLKNFAFKNQLVDIPLNQLAQQVGGSHLMINIVAVGASCFFLGLNLTILKQIIDKSFAKKGRVVVKLNQKAAQAGYNYAEKNYPASALHQSLPVVKKQASLFLTGNQAIALGAIAGGMKFYTAYPMTPATSILHFLAAKAKSAGLAVRHAEDEIGVINSAIGAGFAGVRSMVATSGGGFSLMTEGLGLAGISETPVVIVNSMRPGPASGMPTWSGQGDLLFSINASQDEFPRIVLTPGDPEEAFNLTKSAHNLAEKYQLPVIILSDKYLSESYFTVPKFKTVHQNQRFALAETKKGSAQKPFSRYQSSASGISLRPLPGQPGGIHLANSYEHDQSGYATEESDVRRQQVDKRQRKVARLFANKDIIKPRLFGPKTAKRTLVSWGSNKGTILQAMRQLKDLNFIHFSWIWPFPKQEFTHLAQSCSNLISLECNSTGQLNRLIREQTGISIKHQLLKYDGRPFYAEEIIKQIEKINA